MIKPTKNFKGQWVGHSDMYAVIIKLKDSTEWAYWSDMVYTKSNIKERSYPPFMYLHETSADANAALSRCLDQMRGALSFIKISRMNKYNLESECEVIDGSYRKFK